MYNALHGAIIKDIKIDSKGNLTMRVEDIYNFEKNRPSLRGRIGYKMQKEGKLENYYIVTLIKIPNVLK